MRSFPRPLPGITGRGRRARWRRGVLRRVVAAACVAAAVAIGLQEVRPPPPPRVAVVAVRRPVEAGSVLTTADVHVVAVPAAARPPGALIDPADAVGRRVGSPLVEGEVVTLTRLVVRSAIDGLAPGAVALHVLLADPSSADLVTPGRRVTVHAAADGASLARARVLAVDPIGPDPLLGASGPHPRGVVLELSGPDAQHVLAGQGGLDAGPPIVLLVVVG